MLGTDDVFAALAPDPMPYKNYNLTLNCTIGPNLVNVVPIVGNKSLLYNVSGNPVLQGTAGMQINGCGHRLDNPLRLPVTVQGIVFVHDGAACGSTWDFSNASLTTDGIDINGNILDGAGTSAQPIAGLFDGTFAFANNLVINYTAEGASWTGKSCNTSVLYVQYNQFVDFVGSAGQAHFFAQTYVVGNSFFNVGGFLAGDIAGFLVEMCLPYNRAKNTLAFVGNSLSGRLGVDCSGGPLWTAFYLINVNMTMDNIAVTDNSADDSLCVGLRFCNLYPFTCIRPDPQHDVRQWYFQRNNNMDSASNLDIVIGCADAAGDNARLADIDANPHDNNVLCTYCDDGCFRSSYDMLGWILFWVFFVLFFIALLVCLFCPGWCYCVPSYCYDSGWHWDSFLQMEIPNRRSMWPLLDAKTRGEKMEGNNMHWDPANNAAYQQHMTQRRNAMGTNAFDPNRAALASQ